MTSIGFGLNISSKSKKAGAPTGPPTRKPIARKPPPGFFGAGNDDDDDPKDSKGEDDDNDGGIFAKASKKSSSKAGTTTKPPLKPPSARSSVNAELATHTAHSTSLTKAAEQAALDADSSIYAYDTVFDSMKSASTSRSRTNNVTLDDPETRKPKYMASLLAAAEVRKRDQLRAKERMLQKEREEEGDEFNDKDKFVTEAYKAQQEEMRKLEEEEAIREENERKNSRGLTGLYRNILDRTEAQHEAVVVAVASADVSTAATVDEETPKEDKKTSLPSHVEINDEGVVVDKRQLLQGGLNLLSTGSKKTTKPSAASTSSSTAGAGGRGGYQGKNKAESDRRARQTKMLEEQLEATQKRAREEEEAKAKEVMERQVKRGKTETEVMGAKERYLARKKAKEEEEGKAKKSGGI